MARILPSCQVACAQCARSVVMFFLASVFVDITYKRSHLAMFCNFRLTLTPSLSTFYFSGSTTLRLGTPLYSVSHDKTCKHDDASPSV
jgi:hypothetical protein